MAAPAGDRGGKSAAAGDVLTSPGCCRTGEVAKRATRSGILKALMCAMVVVKYRQAQLPAQRQHAGGKAEQQGGDHHHIVAADVMLKRDV